MSEAAAAARPHMKSVPKAIAAQVAAADAQHAESLGLPAPEQPVGTTVVEAAPAAQEAPQEDFEQKYRTLQGKYDAETRAAREEVAGLQTVLASLANQPAPQPAPVADGDAEITETEEQEYGPEYISFVEKLARRAVNKQLTQVQNEIGQLRGSVQHVGVAAAQDAQRTMHAVLDRSMPDWKAINVSQGFLDWLAIPDRYTRLPRHNLLQRAYMANDAEAVLAFFVDYRAQHTPALPTAQQTPEPIEARPTLETFAAPGRGAPAPAAGAGGGDNIITRAQVSKFYEDVRRGAYRGREAEKDQHEREIFAAGREGRIR